MPQFLIEVKQGAEWRKVTTIRYETDHSGRKDERHRAIERGFLALADWRASDQFTGRPMRLAERVTGPFGRNAVIVITGVRQ